MALALTEEHLALAESVRGWTGRAAPAEALRAAVADGDGGAALYAGTLRPALAGQGLLGLHLPESLGGQGYGLPELAIALEELGVPCCRGPSCRPCSPAPSCTARGPTP